MRDHAHGSRVAYDTLTLASPPAKSAAIRVMLAHSTSPPARALSSRLRVSLSRGARLTFIPVSVES